MVPSETTETLELPAASALPADRYTLRRDRSVVEVSLRVLGVRLLRARLRARRGELVLTGGPEPDPGLAPPVASIEVDLFARPARTAPLVAPLLRGVARRGRLAFTAVDIDLPTGSSSGPVDGEVSAHGSAGAPWSLPLTVRMVPADEGTILLAVRGPVRPPRTLKGWRAGAGRCLWLDAAVEFVR